MIARPPSKSQNRFPNFRAQLSCRKKPAGMNRRAVSSAIAQKDCRYRDFYVGRNMNVNRLPERNRYTHTE